MLRIMPIVPVAVFLIWVHRKKHVRDPNVKGVRYNKLVEV